MFKFGKVGSLGNTVSVIQSRPNGAEVAEYIFEGGEDVGREMARQMNEAKEAGALKQWLQKNQDEFERYSL